MGSSPSSLNEKKGEASMSKVTPFLMFNDQLEAAVEFYTATFPDSKIKNMARSGKDGPVSAAEFIVGGQSFMGYNGGPPLTFSQGGLLFFDWKGRNQLDPQLYKTVRCRAKASWARW